MGVVRYFAYGSNMLTGRLRARVGEVKLLGPARASGRRLAFHVRGADGSGKCDIPEDSGAGTVHGVVYEMPEIALEALDPYEGIGYERTTIEVALDVGNRQETVQARVYLGRTEHIDRELLPFDWYLKLVRAGIREHGLDPEYGSQLAGASCLQDPLPQRPGRREALRALEEFYSRLAAASAGEGSSLDAQNTR